MAGTFSQKSPKLDFSNVYTVEFWCLWISLFGIWNFCNHPLLIPSVQSFVTCSGRSGWDHVCGKVAFPCLLLLHWSLSA